MSECTKRQQALIDELHAIANRIDALALLNGCFTRDDDYISGQCNSRLGVAYQQLEAVVEDIGEHGGDELRAPNENLVLQIVERRRKSRSARGLEAKAAAASRVGGSRLAGRMVVRGAR